MTYTVSCGAIVAALLGAGMIAAPMPKTNPPQEVNPMAIEPASRMPLPAASQVAVIGAEDCEPVDAAELRIMEMGPGHFMIMQGPKPFLTPFPNLASAMSTLHVIQSYKFDQQCYVKPYRMAFMYWKSAGRIPSAKISGAMCAAVDPQQAAVAPSGDDWAVMQGTTRLAAFHHDRNAAERALTLIRAYKMTNRCVANMPNPVMTYWLVP